MRAISEHISEYADFTEFSYRNMLVLAKKNYSFSRFGERAAGKTILLRHDLDASIHRAHAIATIEHEENVVSTYFLFIRCMYYNLFSSEVGDLIRKIIAMGHDIGLHFDPTHYGRRLENDELVRHIETERDILFSEFGVKPSAVSFHLYGVLEQPMPDDEFVGGLVNAYSSKLRETYSYVSDSNGVWLYRRLHDVLSEAKEDRLQVLTHPEWWTPEAMPPRARLQRAIDGYASAMGRWYDETVERSGRPNLR